MEGPRRPRDRYRGVGRLVQPPPALRVLRRPHAGRSRAGSQHSPPDPDTGRSLKLESLRTRRGGSLVNSGESSELGARSKTATRGSVWTSLWHRLLSWAKWLIWISAPVGWVKHSTAGVVGAATDEDGSPFRERFMFVRWCRRFPTEGGHLVAETAASPPRGRSASTRRSAV